MSNPTPPSAVDWTTLRTAATDAIGNAYVPYSHYPVGAAALTDRGDLVVGCNAANASYGVTLCAECSLVSALIGSGGGRLVAFTCCDGPGQLLGPCGRCRQPTSEPAGPTPLGEAPREVRPLTDGRRQ